MYFLNRSHHEILILCKKKLKEMFSFLLYNQSKNHPGPVALKQKSAKLEIKEKIKKTTYWFYPYIFATRCWTPMRF